jgi:Ca-activated chloride channel family protein
MNKQPLSMMVLLLALLNAVPAYAADFAGLWLTADQRGQRLMERGDFAAAAEVFEDPAWRGTALYRAGDFERAAAVFGRLRTPEAEYNRGNALVMLGRYEEAIDSYQAALGGRPDWNDAEQNLEIARIRLQRLAPPEDDAGGTGGKLGADEIVFDDSGRVDRSGSEEVTAGGEALSDQEMRAVWLRRVQNDPKAFLRARFAFQLYRDEQDMPGKDGDD